MTRVEAIQTIIDDVRKNRMSKTAYQKVVRALKTLGLNEDEQIEIEKRLEYRTVENGELYPLHYA